MDHGSVLLLVYVQLRHGMRHRGGWPADVLVEIPLARPDPGVSH